MKFYLIGVLSILTISSATLALANTSADPCIRAAKKAAVSHVKAQDYFLNFDPDHKRAAVIRSAQVQDSQAGDTSYTVNIEYGLPGAENSDVAVSGGCDVEVARLGSHCTATYVGCDF